VNDAEVRSLCGPGYLLYVTTKKTLMVTPFDQNANESTGAPTRVIEGMRLGRFGSATSRFRPLELWCMEREGTGQA